MSGSYGTGATRRGVVPAATAAGTAARRVRVAVRVAAAAAPSPWPTGVRVAPGRDHRRDRDQRGDDRADDEGRLPEARRPAAAEHGDDRADHRDRGERRGREVGELDGLGDLEAVDERDARGLA